MATKRFGPGKGGRGLIWLTLAILAAALVGLGLEHGGGGSSPLTGVLSAKGTPPPKPTPPPKGPNGGGGQTNPPGNQQTNPPVNQGPPAPQAAGAKMSGPHPHGQQCNPQLQANPHDVQPGGTTTVSIRNAFNCGPNGASTDSFTVTFPDNPDTTTTVATDSSGSGSAPLAVPADARQGNNTIYAFDGQGNFAATNVNVQSCSKVDVHAHPNQVTAGQTTDLTITLNGNKQCAGQTFTVTFHGGNNATNTATLDQNGKGQTTLVVTIPANDTAKKHTVTADNGHGVVGFTQVNVKQPHH